MKPLGKPNIICWSGKAKIIGWDGQSILSVPPYYCGLAA
jgi:hypothetical protein